MNHPLYTFSFPVTMMMGSKFIPTRVGIGRAMILGLRSKVRDASLRSERINDINNIQMAVNCSIEHGAFVVVRGPKGIGKTCAVDTALAHRFGVVKFNVHPATTADSIMRTVLDEVSGIPYSYVNKSPSSISVAKWHARFFRIPLTVVLRATEVPPDKKIC